MFHRFRFHLLANLALACSVSVSCVQATDEISRIKGDERVVFFPTVACLSDDRQSWLIPIHGWIFEPEPHDVTRAAAVQKLRESLGLDPGSAATKVFDERIRLFLADNERGKRVGIRIAGKKFVLPASGDDGHFSETIQLATDVVTRFADDGILAYQAITSPDDGREFRGVSHCLPPQGISVISDIDDTIKVTEVLVKKELVRNTFFREFRAVQGMPTAYSRWAEEGARFHFVSASPWQLYEPLSTFMREADFPSATVHLKPLRFKDARFLKLFENPIQYKLSKIEPLLKSFPKRKFILVGDSGEKDPEVYGIVARRYASQVIGIYIRDVTNEPPDAARYQEAFRDLPPDAWQLFHEPTQFQRIGPVRN